jgi:hypothetical protein
MASLDLGFKQLLRAHQKKAHYCFFMAVSYLVEPITVLSVRSGDGITARMDSKS